MCSSIRSIFSDEEFLNINIIQKAQFDRMFLSKHEFLIEFLSGTINKSSHFWFTGIQLLDLAISNTSEDG